MSTKNKYKCSVTVPDRFVNLLMGRGKKNQTYKLLLESLALCKSRALADKSNTKHSLSINQILVQAISSIQPSVETRKVRIGGSTYQVPCITHKQRQEGIAMRWLISCARLRKQASKYNLSECLAQELLEALQKEGMSRQKREQAHNAAAANRAYARYRWW